MWGLYWPIWELQGSIWISWSSSDPILVPKYLLLVPKCLLLVPTQPKMFPPVSLMLIEKPHISPNTPHIDPNRAHISPYGHHIHHPQAPYWLLQTSGWSLIKIGLINRCSPAWIGLLLVLIGPLLVLTRPKSVLKGPNKSSDRIHIGSYKPIVVPSEPILGSRRPILVISRPHIGHLQAPYWSNTGPHWPYIDHIPGPYWSYGPQIVRLFIRHLHVLDWPLHPKYVPAGFMLVFYTALVITTGPISVWDEFDQFEFGGRGC